MDIGHRKVYADAILELNAKSRSTVRSYCSFGNTKLTQHALYFVFHIQGRARTSYDNILSCLSLRWRLPQMDPSCSPYPLVQAIHYRFDFYLILGCLFFFLLLKHCRTLIQLLANYYLLSIRLAYCGSSGKNEGRYPGRGEQTTLC